MVFTSGEGFFAVGALRSGRTHPWPLPGGDLFRGKGMEFDVGREMDSFGRHGVERLLCYDLSAGGGKFRQFGFAGVRDVCAGAKNYHSRVLPGIECLKRRAVLSAHHKVREQVGAWCVLEFLEPQFAQTTPFRNACADKHRLRAYYGKVAVCASCPP